MLEKERKVLGRNNETLEKMVGSEKQKKENLLVLFESKLR